jgi:hypothetical protein
MQKAYHGVTGSMLLYEAVQSLPQCVETVSALFKKMRCRKCSSGHKGVNGLVLLHGTHLQEEGTA